MKAMLSALEEALDAEELQTFLAVYRQHVSSLTNSNANERDVHLRSLIFCSRHSAWTPPPRPRITQYHLHQRAGSEAAQDCRCPPAAQRSRSDDFTFDVAVKSLPRKQRHPLCASLAKQVRKGPKRTGRPERCWTGVCQQPRQGGTPEAVKGRVGRY
jgi:hypothetical protein